MFVFSKNKWFFPHILYYNVPEFLSFFLKKSIMFSQFKKTFINFWNCYKFYLISITLFKILYSSIFIVYGYVTFRECFHKSVVIYYVEIYSNLNVDSWNALHYINQETCRISFRLLYNKYFKIILSDILLISCVFYFYYLLLFFYIMSLNIFFFFFINVW